MANEQPVTGQVADRLHGIGVYRSESLADAEKIAELKQQVRASLIGCTVSQLEDILRSIDRVKFLSSDQEEVDG